MRRAVFLDRDGVLNDVVLRGGKPHPPGSMAEFRVSAGVPEACARLREAGFLLIVVTNQPDVARGTQTREMVEAFHERLRATLPLDDVRVCWHDDRHGCGCRKPAPGLLLDAARDWDIDLAASFMVGDRWKDIEAGRRAGCRTVLLDAPYAEAARCAPGRIAKSLLEATEWVRAQA